MNGTAIGTALLVAAVLLAGCTSETAGAGRDIAQGAIHAHYDRKGDWSPGLGCYDRVSGYAYNAGNASSAAITLNLNLVDTKTGTIRDSKSVFIGTLAAGQSGRFETDLDGECDRDYRVDGTILQ